MDAYLADGALHLEFDVPGVSRDGLRVRVESHLLVVEGERKASTAGLIDPLITARTHGTFRYRLFLGGRCDVDRLEADFADGVLAIVVPLVASARTRHVQVGDGSRPSSRHPIEGAGRDALALTSVA
jgi:HSP20 family protein